MKRELLALVREALLEDLGSEGDVTTNATVSISSMATAILLAKSDGVVAGYEAVHSVFAEVHVLPSTTARSISSNGDYDV